MKLTIKTSLFIFSTVLFLSAARFAHAQDNQSNETPADSTTVETTTAENTTTNNTPNAAHATPLDFIAQDIGANMPSDEYTMVKLTLNVGSEREAEHEFPVFTGESHRPISTGTVYLVSDVAFNGAHIQSLLKIAGSLQALGWHTVVMPAPQLLMVMAEVDALEAELNAENEASDAPAGDTNTDRANPNDADAPKDDKSKAASSEAASPQTMLASRAHQSDLDASHQKAYAAYLGQFVKATIKATDKPGYKVFFAQGMSAQALLAESLNGLEANAMVINNAYWPKREINKTVPDLVAKSPLPVLDLISAQDNNWSLQTRELRKRQALVQIKTHYRQRELGAYGPSSYVDEKVAKDIEGWLSYLGW